MLWRDDKGTGRFNGAIHGNEPGWAASVHLIRDTDRETIVGGGLNSSGDGRTVIVSSLPAPHGHIGCYSRSD